jgi:hypothetical protein
MKIRPTMNTVCACNSLSGVRGGAFGLGTALQAGRTITDG